VSLGTLEIRESGKASLEVRPVAAGWQPINLKSVTFKPAR